MNKEKTFPLISLSSVGAGIDFRFTMSPLTELGESKEGPLAIDNWLLAEPTAAQGC